MTLTNKQNLGPRQGARQPAWRAPISSIRYIGDWADVFTVSKHFDNS
ncbi:MAG: hypothetical protein ACLVL2_15120 [Bacteroides cellulosilyticus]